MIPLNLYRKLSTIDKPHRVTLSSGLFHLKCDQSDATAAKLLLWLDEHPPEGATVGDAIDTLLSALWWLQFTSAMPIEEGKDE